MEEEDGGGPAKDSGQKRFTMHLQRLFQELPSIKELNISKASQALTGEMIRYATVSAGNAFYQEGDPATACFIVLSGKVQHWRGDGQTNVPFAGNSEGGQQASKHCAALISQLSRRAVAPATLQRRGSGTRWPAGAAMRRPGMLAASRKSSLTDAMVSGMQPADDAPIKDFGIIVASNGPGSMFGDAELLVEQPRLTTAVACSETVEVLSIERSDFENAVKAEIHRAEIRQVAPHVHQVMTQFDFFQRLDLSVQLSVAEIMHFTYHRRKDVIFQQGDPGDLCYIILSGEVGIWVNGLKDRDGMSDVSMRKEYGTQVARSSCASILAGLQKVSLLNKLAANTNDTNDTGENNQEPPANAGQVVILGPGRMFGELALLEDQPRSATVVCNEDSAFLTIEKADFERVLKKAMNQAVMSLPLLSEPLLNELPFFQTLRPSVRQRVRHMVKYSVEQRGSVLFWQGDVPNRCYIILSGAVSCWSRANGRGEGVGRSEGGPLDDRQEAPVGEAVYAKCTELASRLLEVNRTETKAEDSKISDEVFEHFGTRRRMARRESMVDMFGDQEAVLSQGSVFGDVELLAGQGCTYSVVCDKDCQFLYIERSDFDRVVKEDLMRMKVQELNMQVRRLLHGFPLFQDLAPSVQEMVPEIVHYTWNSRGTLVFREGDEPDCCYIILSGEVTIFKKRATAVAIGEAASSSNSFPQFPPVSQVHPETYERCVQLAAKLAPVSCCLRQKPACEGALIDLTKNGEVPVASLGPGSLFGELGLLNSNPRNATVYCRKECEFLAIENCDFDRVLKREMARAKDEKLEFLRKYVPGMRSLPERMAEGLLHHFDKKTVPLNHVFVEQGELADGSIYFVWQGSVEFYTQSGKQADGSFSLLPDSSFRRLRVLIKGGVFGAVPVDMRVPFTAVARSAPCEVLHVTMQHLKQLPEPVMRGLRKLLDQTLVWASENCAPILTMSRESERRGSIRDGPGSPGAPVFRLGTAARGNSHSLPALSKVPRLQSSKIPRPLSMKIPRPLDIKPGLSSLASSNSNAPSARGSPASGSDKKLSKSWGGGLFQRTSAEASNDAFEMNPGETMALKAKMPRKREISLHMGPHMGKSLSLPQMRRAPDCSQMRSPERSQELR